MREPAAIAQRENRPQIKFCAQCDGGPVRAPTRDSSASSAASFRTANGDVPAPSAAHETTLPSGPSTPRRRVTPPGTPSPSLATRSQTPTSPPGSHVASARGDPDAATDAISDLMLRGYSLLSSTCPDPSCKNIPLVGFPRRSNGQRDPRRECVSCGKRWVDEKDLAASGLRLSETASTSSSTSNASNNAQSHSGSPLAKGRRNQETFSAAAQLPKHSAASISDIDSKQHLPHSPTSQVGSADQPESPRSKAIRELYAHGAEVMEERARNQAAKKAEDERLAAAAVLARSSPSNVIDDAFLDSATPNSAHAAHPTVNPDHKFGFNADSTDATGSMTDTPNASTASRRKPFVADEHRPSAPDGKLRVVIISSGSVASVKIPFIVAALKTDPNVEVQVVSTDSSLYFYDKDTVQRQNEGVSVWRDADEWSDWQKIGDPILHIELRRWADLVVVAPCSANMLAKIAGGICDDLPLSMLRALSADTPVILCPAMNTHMFSHPLTARHMAFANEVLGYHILGPQGAGMLACGDVGAGKMTEWTDIVRVIRGFADGTQKRPSSGKRDILKSILAPLQTVQELPDVFYTPKQLSPVDSMATTVIGESKSVGRKLFEVFYHPRPPPTRPFTLSYETPKKPTAQDQRVARKSALSPVILIYSALCNALFLPALHLISLGSRIVWDAMRAPSVLMGYVMAPVLILLHVFFTISSVVLRVVQGQPKLQTEIAKVAPSHVALILVPGKLGYRVTNERYIESVRRAVLWAAEWGVSTLTVWDDQGLGMRLHGIVTDSLLDFPPSPPSSGAPSPRGNNYQMETLENLANETQSASVYVNSDEGPRRVELHFLAPSASDTLARVARKFAQDGVDPDHVDQATLDAALKRDLRIPSDPDLVIIHHLAPPNFLRGLLPRPAPELHGFPAWLLRISEIYTHPPPLPLYVPFLGALLQNSPLPIFRKIGASFPSSEDKGILSLDAWEGAQAAWEKLEQRKGA